eukprot:1143039-Pelagomonas_calceolata.AAC.1
MACRMLFLCCICLASPSMIPNTLVFHRIVPQQRDYGPAPNTQEWGKDKDADAAAEAKLEVKKLPALLQVPDCQRWLDAGLLVVRAADIMEDDDDGGV